MIRYTRLDHRFVDDMPEALEPGVLYVSIRYALALHLCCCGCGREISTPFTPAQWKLSFDGDTVSLSPSVGNWNLPCRSHYIIDHNRVLEALPWSEKAAELGAKRDRRARDSHYGKTSRVEKDTPPPLEPKRWTWREWASQLFK